jgi:hypothetical protein
MPPVAETPARRFRAEDDLWHGAMRTAEERGEILSEQLRGFLVDYIAQNLPGYMSGFVAGVEAVKNSAVSTEVATATKRE